MVGTFGGKRSGGGREVKVRCKESERFSPMHRLNRQEWRALKVHALYLLTL
jgi:hypothetical protein